MSTVIKGFLLLIAIGDQSVSDGFDRYIRICLLSLRFSSMETVTRAENLPRAKILQSQLAGWCGPGLVRAERSRGLSDHGKPPIRKLIEMKITSAPPPVAVIRITDGNNHIAWIGE